jgi:hypothetical protein
MKLTLAFAVAVLLMLPVAKVHADPCAGGTSSFTDVPDSANYCTNTQWMKNRAITLGCGAGTTYCPAEFVTRASMALFMNRLGTALTPTPVFVEEVSGAFVTNSTNGVNKCVSGPYLVTGFPRTATFSGTFAGTSAGGMTIRAISAYSTDGGTTWTPTGTYFLRSTGAAGAWTQSTSFGTLDLVVGQTYRFTLSIVSDAVSQSIADSRCQLLVTIGNRNGATAPFDPAN